MDQPIAESLFCLLHLHPWVTFRKQQWSPEIFLVRTLLKKTELRTSYKRRWCMSGKLHSRTVHDVLHQLCYRIADGTKPEVENVYCESTCSQLQLRNSKVLAFPTLGTGMICKPHNALFPTGNKDVDMLSSNILLQLSGKTYCLYSLDQFDHNSSTSGIPKSWGFSVYNKKFSTQDFITERPWLIQ